MTTLLVANRGEIARRIFRTARRLGFGTVAVYSDADASLPFVREADVAVRLGPAPARESYLDVARVLAAARESGAELVHPGYGFLAESPEFASAVAEAGLRFVGPTPEALRALGEAQAVPSPRVPLPGAYPRALLPVLESRVAVGELSLRGVNETTLEIPEGLLVDADTPAALADLERLA